MTDQLTRAQLRKILKAIRFVADIDKDTRNAIVCALVGHSRIVEKDESVSCCARCGAYLMKSAKGRVIKKSTCKCEVCFNHRKALTWRDILYVRDPFKEGM